MMRIVVFLVHTPLDGEVWWLGSGFSMPEDLRGGGRLPVWNDARSPEISG